jgi:hypothetical protein
MYFGGLIFFEESFNLVHAPTTLEKVNGVLPDDPPENIVWKQNRKELDTICFHTFILMNLFNSINCRIVDTKELT